MRVIPVFVLHSIRIPRRVAMSAEGHQIHALSFYPDMASVSCAALALLISTPAANLTSLFLPLSDPAAGTKLVGGTPIYVPHVYIWFVDDETFAFPALCPLDSFASPTRRHVVKKPGCRARVKDVRSGVRSNSPALLLLVKFSVDFFCSQKCLNQTRDMPPISVN